MMRISFFWLLSAFLFLCYVISGINPVNPSVWWVEMASVFAVHLFLICIYKKIEFSKTSYIIVSMWLILHTIGAHYTFEEVPFDWVTNLLGSNRNHFDRLAHLVIGLNSYVIAEYLIREKLVNSIKTAAFFGFIFMMAIAGIWEIIEWMCYDGSEVGKAFIGAQDDFWDAQKDMLMDLFGAIAASIGFVYFPKTKDPKKS